MDVSESMNTYMRDTDKSRLTTAKNFVMNLFSQLDSEDKIGVVILTSSPFSITFNLVPLENNTDFFRAALMPVIAQDGAYMPDALNEAENLFRGNDFKGEKHIVLLFDGVSSKNQFNKTREKVTEMADGGVTIHAVNVGFDSIKDEDFIKEIVKLGNGHYFEPDQYTDLKAEIDKT
ncbi:MAG: VWA domain-containing protein [Candidatus Altiarchaeota archaeon]|nr:VWA domain-containing protein [Candidatus Altiarchaeota archaeon]